MRILEILGEDSLQISLIGALKLKRINSAQKRSVAGQLERFVYLGSQCH